MLRIATPLAILVLLAGCLGAPEESAPKAGARGTGATQADATGADAPSAAATSDANVTDPEPVMPVGTPISYSGSAPVGACQFIAGQCAFVVGGSEDYHLLDVVGQARTLAIQVTYAGQAPGMDFYVGVCMGEDESGECLEYKTGPSPLVAEWDLSAYPPGTSFGISIGSLNTPAMQTATMVFGPADFEVAGTLTSVPLA